MATPFLYAPEYIRVGVALHYRIIPSFGRWASSDAFYTNPQVESFLKTIPDADSARYWEEDKNERRFGCPVKTVRAWTTVVAVVTSFLRLNPLTFSQKINKA